MSASFAPRAPIGDLKVEARKLVLRSRMGDQNASAMIAAVSAAAKRGVKQAKAAYAAIMKFIRDNPVAGRPYSLFGAEMPPSDRETLAVLKALPVEAPILLPALRSSRAHWAAAVILANGCWLGPSELAAWAQRASDPMAWSAFSFGCDCAGRVPPAARRAAMGGGTGRSLVAGEIAGLAMKIQAVRSGGRIFDLSPAAAWELGEVGGGEAGAAS